MKAMILAAGLGTRMRPLTDNIPKPLLRVGGRALIEHHLLNLARAGIREVVINHYYLGAMLEEAIGDGSDYGVDILWSRETERVETAGGIIQALPLLGNESFVVVNGDVWSDYPFERLRPVDGIQTQASLVLVNNPEHNPEGDFYLAAGRVHEEPRHPQAPKLTFSGLSVLHPTLFAGLEEGLRPLAPLLRAAMARDLVSGEHYTGGWVDIGTPERLRELDERLSHAR